MGAGVPWKNWKYNAQIAIAAGCNLAIFILRYAKETAYGEKKIWNEGVPKKLAHHDANDHLLFFSSWIMRYIKIKLFTHTKKVDLKMLTFSWMMYMLWPWHTSWQRWCTSWKLWLIFLIFFCAWLTFTTLCSSYAEADNKNIPQLDAMFTSLNGHFLHKQWHQIKKNWGNVELSRQILRNLWQIVKVMQSR